MIRLSILSRIILLSLLSYGAFAKYSGGSGTSGDPYKIATTADLIELSKTTADWSSTFIQTANITFDANEQNVDWDDDGTANWDAQDQLGFSPIGNGTTKFTGTYDGQEYKISNLFIDRSSTNYVALFGWTDGSTIKNLGVVDCNISGKNYVGGLVGLNNNSSSIENSYSTGAVTGSAWDVGGLVGLNNNSSSIENSYSTGAVDGNNYVGGLVGINWGSSIKNSYSTGAVTGSGSNVGGLVGLNQFSSSITNSYSTGAVTGSAWDVGGLVGGNYGSSSIENSYSTGAVNGNNNFGGFIGKYDGGTLTANYWKEDGTLDDTGGGDIGNINETSDANMKLQVTYVDWDFTTTWKFESGVNNGYPVHFWQFPQSAPVLSSFGAKATGSESASFNVDVADGGASTTVTFEYGTSSNNYSTTINATETSGNNTTVSVSSSTTGLNPRVQYFVRARAENSVSYSLSDEASFWTLTNEPTTHSSSFVQIGEANNSITLSFQKLSGINADGYLIVSHSADARAPQDGVDYPTNTIYSGTKVIAKVTDKNRDYVQITGLAMQTRVNYKIFPFNEGTEDPATVNYLTANAPSLNAYTIPTLGEWAMIGFVGLFAIGGFVYIRQRA